jgi:glycosyltransferase involved in cell wall biosynthesis
MKILWFSPISLSLDKTGKFYYPGGNWIHSLKELLKNEQNIELGIAYFGDNESTFQDSDGTKYYQILRNSESKLSKLFKNWRHEIDDFNQIDKLLGTIDDFKPDVIHIFGTESVFGKIINSTPIPVIIHLQGLINPCLNAWKFSGYNTISLLRNSNLILLLKGYGYFHNYFRFKKMAQRELDIFSCGVNFMGRTHWDKEITKLYSPKAAYFHCDEVIRDGFYYTKWKMPKSEKVNLSSTMNPNIYKGLDLILKTAILLKKNSSIDFEWNIYGIEQNSEYANLVADVVGDSFDNNNIVFNGMTLADDLLNGILKSQLFVHPSYIDNSPNSVCEAQLIGLPVISTNVGGISSLIKDGVDGFLVPSNEPHMLASKIIDLVNDPDRLKLISSNSIKVANDRHNRSKIKSDLLNIYNEILNKSDYK